MLRKNKVNKILWNGDFFFIIVHNARIKISSIVWTRCTHEIFQHLLQFADQVLQRTSELFTFPRG